MRLVTFCLLGYLVEVDKIYLYPFGGISKFFLPLNFSFLKEFIILIAGPIFQFIMMFFLIKIFPDFSYYIKTYHYGMIIFNLLPIYPLDGGRLLQLIFSMVIPFKYSFIFTLYISYLLIIIYFVFSINYLKLNSIFMFIFLLYKVSYYYFRVDNIYEKFLLERYLYNYYFKRTKYIKNPKCFYKNRRHIIRIGSNYYTENEFLLKKYKNI